MIMTRYLTCHTIALFLGIILDLAIGDPHWIWHPVRLIGRGILYLEKKLLHMEKRDSRKEFYTGIAVWAIVAGTAFVTVFVITAVMYALHQAAGTVCEAILTCYALAARSLYDESMLVYRDLKAGDVPKARKDLSMIVGRDTERLSEEGVVRAAVETVSENTSDGVAAPLFYAVIAGPCGAFLYKAVNTMDSMLGYRNDRYEYFGKAAAKADDIANFIPSRLSALCMIAAAGIMGVFTGNYDGKGAFRIWKRDRRAHISPNSAQTESVCAGALGISLGGVSYYGGIRKEKPMIGDPLRTPEVRDIRRANFLMFGCEAVFSALCGLFLILLL